MRIRLQKYVNFKARDGGISRVARVVLYNVVKLPRRSILHKVNASHLVGIRVAEILTSLYACYTKF